MSAEDIARAEADRKARARATIAAAKSHLATLPRNPIHGKPRPTWRNLRATGGRVPPVAELEQAWEAPAAIEPTEAPWPDPDDYDPELVELDPPTDLEPPA